MLPIEQHLVDKPLLHIPQLVPRAGLAQVGSRGDLGLVQIIMHRFLVGVLAHAFLKFDRGIAEGLVRRDALVKLEWLESDVTCSF